MAHVAFDAGDSPRLLAPLTDPVHRLELEAAKIKETSGLLTRLKDTDIRSWQKARSVAKQLLRLGCRTDISTYCLEVTVHGSDTEVSSTHFMLGRIVVDATSKHPRVGFNALGEPGEYAHVLDTNPTVYRNGNWVNLKLTSGGSR
jgi:hypothetical protein